MDKNQEGFLLRKDLGKLEKPEQIKDFIEDVKILGGHENILSLAQQKLEALSEDVQAAVTVPPNLVSRVEKMGGTNEELRARTAPSDAAAYKEKEDTAARIRKVVGEGNGEIVQEAQPDSEQQQKSKKFLEELRDYTTHTLKFLGKHLSDIEQWREQGTSDPSSELIILNNDILSTRQQIDFTKAQIDALHGLNVSKEFGIEGGFLDKWRNFIKGLRELTLSDKENLANELTVRIVEAQRDIDKALELRRDLV